MTPIPPRNRICHDLKQYTLSDQNWAMAGWDFVLCDVASSSVNGVEEQTFVLTSIFLFEVAIR